MHAALSPVLPGEQAPCTTFCDSTSVVKGTHTAAPLPCPASDDVHSCTACMGSVLFLQTQAPVTASVNGGLEAIQISYINEQ